MIYRAVSKCFTYNTLNNFAEFSSLLTHPETPRVRYASWPLCLSPEARGHFLSYTLFNILCAHLNRTRVRAFTCGLKSRKICADVQPLSKSC